LKTLSCTPKCLRGLVRAAVPAPNAPNAPAPLSVQIQKLAVTQVKSNDSVRGLAIGVFEFVPLLDVKVQEKNLKIFWGRYFACLFPRVFSRTRFLCASCIWCIWCVLFWSGLGPVKCELDKWGLDGPGQAGRWLRIPRSFHEG
jgi:hypothetical protein